MIAHDLSLLRTVYSIVHPGPLILCLFITIKRPILHKRSKIKLGHKRIFCFFCYYPPCRINFGKIYCGHDRVSPAHIYGTIWTCSRDLWDGTFLVKLQTHKCQYRKNDTFSIYFYVGAYFELKLLD